MACGDDRPCLAVCGLPNILVVGDYKVPGSVDLGILVQVGGSVARGCLAACLPAVALAQGSEGFVNNHVQQIWGLVLVQIHRRLVVIEAAREVNIRLRNISLLPKRSGCHEGYERYGGCYLAHISCL